MELLPGKPRLISTADAQNNVSGGGARKWKLASMLIINEAVLIEAAIRTSLQSVY